MFCSLPATLLQLYLQGVIVQFRVMDGELRRGDLVKFMNTG